MVCRVSFERGDAQLDGGYLRCSNLNIGRSELSIRFNQTYLAETENYNMVKRTFQKLARSHTLGENMPGETPSDLLRDAMNAQGITENELRAGIGAIAGGESALKPISEVSYRNTSNSRIRQIFGAAR